MLNSLTILVNIIGEVMENEEILQYLSKLDKKCDKILTMQTKIAKALHLLPVTEKEERAIQIQQRTNLNQAAKVSAQLDEMENKSSDSSNDASLGVNLFNAEKEVVYEDIIGNDVFK